ncbi:MAG: pyridoxal 5'-phosphate synthase lyase subunit PdxS, partial [Acidobacteriota bacterium]
EAVFVGSRIFKPSDPAKRDRAIVEATTHLQDPARVAKASEDLGEGMKGIEAAKLTEAEQLQTRGW